MALVDGETLSGFPQTFDIDAYQGDDFQLQFQISDVSVDAFGVTTKTPRDISGYGGAAMTVRDVATPQGTIILSAVYDNTFAADGWVIMNIGNVDMAAVGASTYYYDVEVTDAAGLITTYLRGRFVVVPQVTVV